LALVLAVPVLAVPVLVVPVRALQQQV